MKVPWDETPEVYDNTPPWERKEELEKQQVNNLNTAFGYVPGFKVTGNQNVYIGPVSKDVSLAAGKITQACPQCGQLLHKMSKCYMCHICGSTYAIEED